MLWHLLDWQASWGGAIGGALGFSISVRSPVHAVLHGGHSLCSTSSFFHVMVYAYYSVDASAFVLS